jgi:hypothetical protein
MCSFLQGMDKIMCSFLPSGPVLSRPTALVTSGPVLSRPTAVRCKVRGPRRLHLPGRTDDPR